MKVQARGQLKSWEEEDDENSRFVKSENDEKEVVEGWIKCVWANRLTERWHGSERGQGCVRPTRPNCNRKERGGMNHPKTGRKRAEDKVGTDKTWREKEVKKNGKRMRLFLSLSLAVVSRCDGDCSLVIRKTFPISFALTQTQKELCRCCQETKAVIRISEARFHALPLPLLPSMSERVWPVYSQTPTCYPWASLKHSEWQIPSLGSASYLWLTL